jgi:hypothetical protein
MAGREDQTLKHCSHLASLTRAYDLTYMTRVT